MVSVAHGIFSILRSVNVKRSLGRAAQEFDVDRHTADAILKIASKLEFSPESWRRFVGTDIIAVASKELRISKREVSGLISLLMGDLQNPYVESLLRSFLSRNNFPHALLPFLTAVLNLLTSKDNSEVLHAVRTLGLQHYQSLIMIGKKMIHPKYVDEHELLGFGLRQENLKDTDKSLIQERLELSMDTNDIHDWINRAAKHITQGSSRGKKRPALEVIPEEIKALDAYEQDDVIDKIEANPGATIEMTRILKKPARGQLPAIERRRSSILSTNSKLLAP